MSHIEPDPKIAQEMALEALRVAIAQRRDVAVGAAIYDRYDRPMLSQDSFRAWHDATCAEYDRLAAVVARQEKDVRTVRAVVDAAGKLPLEQFESMPELREKLNALLEQFEDRINAVDEAESLARVRAYKAKPHERGENHEAGA